MSPLLAGATGDRSSRGLAEALPSPQDFWASKSQRWRSFVPNRTIRRWRFCDMPTKHLTALAEMSKSEDTGRCLPKVLAGDSGRGGECLRCPSPHLGGYGSGVAASRKSADPLPAGLARKDVRAGHCGRLRLAWMDHNPPVTFTGARSVLCRKLVEIGVHDRQKRLAVVRPHPVEGL